MFPPARATMATLEPASPERSGANDEIAAACSRGGAASLTIDAARELDASVACRCDTTRRMSGVTVAPRIARESGVCTDGWRSPPRFPVAARERRGA